ncbi:MAG: GntR family transcriptional regulator, partial [Bacteroidales bacterium]|nr:GntR family transcriptional regulator [Bacteroidales bacterium]
KTGYAKVVDFSDTLLERIRSNGGSLPYTDRTDPETIYRVFGVSKKTFKKAVGDLYRKRMVELREEGLFLTRH